MSKKPALGRGFEGLIPTGFDVSGIASANESVRQIAVNSIVTNPDQPRKEFDESAIEELASSIREHGIIQPIIVTTTSDSNSYRIVAGERRYRAAIVAKLTKIPAIVRNHQELEELEIALVENVQRVDLSPIEQAISIIKLRDQFSLSTKNIAKKLGKAETTISNMVRLLRLPKEAIDALQKQQITEGHARAILALKDDVAKQSQLLNTIITQKLSVREAEEFVQKNRKSNIAAPKGSVATRQIWETVAGPLRTRAVLVPSSSKPDRGVVKISYASAKELEDIVARISENGI